jgi:Flp pilus assembly protein TadG
MREFVMRTSVPGKAMRMAGSLQRFWRHSQGAAAVEFAFLAPLLLLMLLGTIEIGRAVNIDRHFSMATASAGDLVAREEWLGTSSSNATANLNSMMLSIKQVMQPYDASTMKLGIFQVRASTTNASDTKVDWVFSYNGKTVPTKCQTYTLPAGLIGKGGSVIVVESSYLFKPLFADFVPGFSGQILWSDKSLNSPRNSCVDYVKPSGSACLSSC